MNGPHYRRPPFHRRDRIGFAGLAWLVVFGAILGAAVVLSAHAHATVEQDRLDICVELRNHVSLGDIEQELELTGFSAAAARRYTGEQVKLYCPDMYVALVGQLA